MKRLIKRNKTRTPDRLSDKKYNGRLCMKEAPVCVFNLFEIFLQKGVDTRVGMRRIRLLA
ncbi:hypothetical protein SAMN04487964_11589 [Marinobacterium sediminicola]|uniref:Uncharacterized protein n=1 Tax=Marinobacterium sediminicola TaxID=518898 RepID=A0ABY1S354_9GAMM|nr:hypothetical protein SAMN04487964_11589 [Marinobacterium sediminicola]